MTVRSMTALPPAAIPARLLPLVLAACLLVASALAGCTLAGGPPPPPVVLPAGVTAVGPGAYVFQAGAERSLFLVGQDGVIVTDPLGPGSAPAYRAAIRALTDQPVRYVVYSHNHWDRILGASLFTEEGARVVAQERCLEFFRARPNPALVRPDITFRDRLTLKLRGASLELRHFGPAHGDCLTVFHARPANLLQVVDLVDVARGAFPADPLVPNLRPHNLREFFAAVDGYARSQRIAGVVASSARDGGPVVGPADAIHQQGEFWELVYETVEAAEARGAVGNDSMPRLRPGDLEPFRAYAGFDAGNLNLIMRRIVAFEAMGR